MSQTSSPQVMDQADRFASPWSKGEKIKLVLWYAAWVILCRWTPKPLNPWRLFVMRVFGCAVTGRPFVFSSAIVRAPWRLRLDDRACLGPKSEVYNLGPVTLHENATVSQHVYLCAGSHDFTQEHRPLTVAPIVLEPQVFVGAKALILMGVTVGRGAIVGAGAVVAKDVAPGSIVVGNPARPLPHAAPTPSQDPPTH
ncbi:MAG: putative colanic acid biosynthesis acetyltransferase [Planctomycetota bacterium]